jgi:glycosyl hydrolase family 26
VRTRRTFRIAGVLIAGLGCALVAAGLGDLPRAVSRVSLTEQRLPASVATWVGFHSTAGDDGLLRAGDTNGGAVTYLKFDVPGWVWGPAVRLELTGTGAPMPDLVELVAVPDTGWDPATLTWQNAPVLGRVVESVRPAGQTVTFALPDLVAQPGTYAFAVTVPPDRGHAAFAGAGGPGEPVLRLPQHRPVSPTASPPVPPLESYPLTAPPPVPSTAPSVGPTAPADQPRCTLGEKLVPSCGVLWGVAPAAHTNVPRAAGLAAFEAETGRRQDIYHSYHRGRELFPTAEERRIAAGGRLLFLNWKPLRWSWEQVAAGAADSYLDRLAEHINATFPDPFFFTVHHEPENDVRPWQGSGASAADYAAMYRHVVERLRSRGVDNLVTVIAYMAYVPWNTRPWFPELYPGDDVVDWIAWDVYAYSDPGFGYGDFAEMMNRRASRYPDWPGFYTWATGQFPDKPFMLAEWGVWHSRRNPHHMARFYDSVARQTPLFPRTKALVYFDTPADQRAMNSRPASTEAGLAAYRRLGSSPYFQVDLSTGLTGADR